jgi:membrane-bound lytic murein transglycosylase D
VGGRWSRWFLLLAAAGLARAEANRSNQAPMPTAPPPVHQQYIKIPPQPKPAPPKPPPELAQLRTLIESGEKALEEKDWDGAMDYADQADDLFDALPEDLLKLTEVAALRTRLTDLQQHLPDTEEVPLLPDPGLKEAEEVGPLTPEELRTELEQVQGAEMGAVFDFPIDLNDKVLAWVHQFTTTKRGFMERSLTRASRYLPMVRQIFGEEGIPQDLAYLAVIESGFINSAASYAKAVGMWQFIRSTGRIYGLGGNGWVEERRDPVKATRAAARYLKRLYELSGDWYLALASYNAGPLTTERAILNLGSRNFWDMYRSRWLRNQTKNYVPELCAAILVGRFPERYGLKVEQLAPYTYETVAVDRMTSLPVLARYADTDVEALKDLNPELLRATTPPGRYTLRVPPGQSGVTARALARIPANQRLDFKPIRLRRGMTLARVAARYNLSEEDLLEANSITRTQFRPGRTILVPPPPASPIDDRDLLSKVERDKSIEDRPLDQLPAIPAEEPATPLVVAREAAAVPAEPSAEAAPHPAAPHLQAARNAARLPAYESEKPAGRAAAREEKPVLRAAVREEGPVPRASAREEKPAARVAAPEPRVPPVHVVKRGETLFAIAERYNLDLKSLRKLNHLKKNTIQAGVRLRLR